MSRATFAATSGFAVVVSASLLASILSMPAVAVGAAASPSPSDVPISVVIPSTSVTPTPTQTPAPTPSPSSSSGGTNGGGSSSGSGASGGGTTGGGTTTGTNPDGSPIPPASPTADAPGLELDRASLTYSAHDWVIATGTGYTPGEKVQFVLYPGAVVLGSFVADASGTVTARIRVPDDTRPGTHTIEATGWTSRHVTNREVTVTAVASANTWLWWVIVVLGILVAGLVALAIYFRESIRGWFDAGASTAGALP